MCLQKIIIILILSIFPAFGQSKIKSIDMELAKKLELKEYQTTLGSLQLYQEYEEKFEHELNLAYDDLIKELQGSTREAFCNAQKVWIVFRDSQFEAFAAISDRREYGSGQGPIIAMLRMKMIRERAVQLRGYTNGLWGPQNVDPD